MMGSAHRSVGTASSYRHWSSPSAYRPRSDILPISPNGLHVAKCRLMSIPATSAPLIEPIPPVRDARLTQVTKKSPKLRMVLFVFAVFVLAAIGDPVKGRAPIVFDNAPTNVWLGRWIAQIVNRLFDIKGGLAMCIVPHWHTPIISIV